MMKKCRQLSFTLVWRLLAVVFLVNFYRVEGKERQSQNWNELFRPESTGAPPLDGDEESDDNIENAGDSENDVWRRRIPKPPITSMFKTSSKHRLIRKVKSADEPVRVFVGYRGDKGLELVSQHSTVNKNFGEIQVAAVTVTLQDLETLSSSSDVTYYEQDNLLYPLSSFSPSLYKVIPYGIRLTQSNFDMNPIPPTGDCNDSRVTRVAIIDTGLATGLPDLNCAGPSDPACMGASFGTNEPWYQDDWGHGTQVAGVIASSSSSLLSQGVVRDASLCLMIARVFDSSSNAAAESDVLDAVRWAVNNGAKVINVSLGSYQSSVTASQLFSSIKQQAVVVSASGNDGPSTELNYPASYYSVVSVGAVDEKVQPAPFSNFNYAVDFVAPGVDIVTTTSPSRGTSVAQLVMEDQNVAYAVPVMYGGTATNGSSVSGRVLLCTMLGECPLSNETYGHVCLIPRGNVSFEEKAKNCESEGGVAAIIYNDADGFFQGMLPNATNVSIPVVAVSGTIGSDMADAVNLSAGTTTTASITVYTECEFVSGSTSMAAAYVSGALAGLRRSCPLCSTKTILKCLRQTSIDGGTASSGEFLGNGLIQTKPAYRYCVKRSCCNTTTTTAV